MSPRQPALLQGFDEYMNLVLAETEECILASDPADSRTSNIFSQRTKLGTILLKGENIALMGAVSAQEP